MHDSHRSLTTRFRDRADADVGSERPFLERQSIGCGDDRSLETARRPKESAFHLTSDCIFRLKVMRRDLIEPAAKLHRATLVRYAGDSVLAEFPSVSSAVIFAVEIQRRLPEIEKYVPEERRIRIRIGISSGPVFMVDGDLHGTSVNIASRLQALAAPGEIYLSEAALDQAHSNLFFRCQSLGTRQLKNIASPVQIYRIPLEELLPNTDNQALP
jgi:class 3 adenylate cyclase